MKVRIGYALGTQGLRDPSRLGAVARDLDRLRFDSLWLSDRLTGAAPDPLIGLAVAAGQTRRLKLGTSVLVLPGRNPIVVAKQVASLDRLSDGRLLVAVGLGASDAREHRAFGIESRERGAWVEEVVPLLRRLWTEERVDHDGPRFHYRGLTVLPRPVQHPIDVWLGGLAPAALRRIGRVGDGWLPSFCTVAEAVQGRTIVCEAAEAADRRIDPEHFGAMLVYALRPPGRAVLEALAARRPDVEASLLVPVGLAAIRERLQEFVNAGISKLVLRPADEPDDWTSEVEALAPLVRELQT